MKKLLMCSAAMAAVAAPITGFAQSTGSIEAEGDTIIVTGATGPQNVNGIQSPESPKAKAVLTQEFIDRRPAGQTIFETINMVPGVNFTNSDPYGGSGGNLRIRGFDGARISATFDGVQVNDSGNYSLYTNQQLDPELIEQVNINFGATDVDSPTASASGGTVNYRTRLPKDDLGAAVVYSHGSFDYNRIFGVLDTGVFTSFGTKAFLSASNTRYEQFRGPGELRKTQVNARIYQPLGSNGDFISLAGHYNENRNHFYRRIGVNDMRTLLGSAAIPAAGNAVTAPGAAGVILPANPLDLGTLNATQRNALFNFNNDASCTLTTPGAGRQDENSLCGNYYNTAINPSDTGNIRFNSRYTLTDKLILTVDGSYQYVRANGGGTRVYEETNPATGTTSNQFLVLGAGIAAGRDLNGDGDLRDRIRFYFPSNTRTHRLSATASLRYDIDESNIVRLAYTWDRARHRQTGEAQALDRFGNPADVFADDATTITDAAGNVIQKRNRLSYAILHQVAGEYRGSFLNDDLKVQLGLRAPFFRRNLNNYCYTIPGSSNDAYCTAQTPAQVAADPRTIGFGAPYTNRVLTYSAVLPNAGVTYRIAGPLSVFASYSQGFSAPRTDNLYGFDGVTIRPASEVKPEKTTSFDLGARYTTNIIQAQLTGWYIKYQDRIISSQVLLDDGSTLNLDRNVGRVRSYGFDGSIGVQPIKQLSLYAFASYTHAKLRDNVLSPAGAVLSPTAGKFVAETPKWQLGGRAQVDVEPFSIGAQVKYVGDRYLTDINDVIAPSYTTVDLDARLDIGQIGRGGKTYVQFNVINLFDKFYYGNLSTQPAASNNPQVEIGSPRTLMGSIHMEF